MEKFNIEEVKVHRTLEGNIFEIVTAVIIVVMYTIAIATKFFDFDNLMGKHLAIIVLSVISIFLLLAAYSPKNINTIPKPTNIRQVEIAIRIDRIIAVELALFCLLMVAISPDNPIIHILFFITLIITALVSSALIRKAK
ncbi:MAG: hypothetical protein IJ580_01640 [Prevotella sp.]|nr:hypothetical protein [Prevotella sp.]